MVDLVMLNEEIKNSGLKKNYIADRMGITVNGFNKKLTGKSDFKLSEAEKLCSILGIDSNKKKLDIFLPVR